jgi:hypothetical protein
MAEKRVFHNIWANYPGTGRREFCQCLPMNRSTTGGQLPIAFHPEVQDVTAPGWLRLLDLVEEAAADGRAEFAPLVELSSEERRQVITLPATVAKLTAVEHLVLYGSNLVRLPPELGAMTSLKRFSSYTSYRLHWFPYELVRCANLADSTVSTRAIYGNVKYRPAFPRLSPPAPEQDAVDLTNLDPGVWGATAIRACSVCRGPVDAGSLRQVWISSAVATDVLPLLVNACSDACVQALPRPTAGYVPTPHRGGPDVEQPARR